MSALEMGAGRRSLTDKIKPEVGFIIEKRIGDTVEKGEPLAIIHAPDKNTWQHAEQQLLKAFRICDHKVVAPPLFYETF